MTTTSNTSAPGPGGIPYRLWKTWRTNETSLWRDIRLYRATNVGKGEAIDPLHHNGQTIVSIPKPGKDKESTKGWRPIALSNCIHQL
ncbi:hypothetical protein DFH27DRAFT_338418 [Peziza echinospora]|nr:hypothetical protein DFH27DRAFT_338418 [Peziza echinospora]